jgi:hypothetical protein
MTALYHFRGRSIDFVTIGKLTQHEGMSAVVCAATWDNAQQLQLNAKANSPVHILVEVVGEVVAVMPVYKIRVADRKGKHLEIWAIVDLPTLVEDPGDRRPQA